MRNTVAVTGASGFIGSHLCAFLRSSGRRVIALARGGSPQDDRVLWNPTSERIEGLAERDLSAVVHLGGVNIAAGRWTAKRKLEIRNSRVLGTHNLSAALASMSHPPAVLVCASAVGCYGDRGGEVLDEGSLPGVGFLPDVCREWEAAADPARAAGIRVVHLRIGMVLSPNGGALARMLPIFRFGLGGRFGSGRQYLSWIGLADLLRAFELVIDDQRLAGPVNGVSPHPVTNAELTRILGRVLRRPALVRVPEIAARVMFGEMAEALLLSSVRAVPKRLIDAGFVFEGTDLEQTLRGLLRS